ncbi:MAG: hypothetical protein MUP30_08355 [Deltaproteobacteria bacterium]|nr:hypothetical protein [Deltaproteobacteria bacterium]
MDIMINIKKAAEKAIIPSVRKRALLYILNGDGLTWMNKTGGSKTNKKATCVHMPGVNIFIISL